MAIRQLVANGGLRIPGSLRSYDLLTQVREHCLGRPFISSLLVGFKMISHSPSKTGVAASKNPANIGIVRGTERSQPRFLTIKRIDNGDFSKTSPFVISKAIYSILGETKSIKKIKDGLMIQTVSNAQSMRLMEAKEFLNLPVEVVPHRTLNYSKGVIVCKDLTNCTIDEAKSELKCEGVIDLKRIQKRVQGELQDTISYIVTFDTPVLPKKLKIAYHCVEVRPFIPNPIRCFKCHKFGHISNNCKETVSMCHCGLSVHEGSECQDPKQCINCLGSHSSTSRNCPIFKFEAEIQKIRTLERCTYFEAKKKIVNVVPTPGVSYSKAAQTDPTAELLKKLMPSIVDAVNTQLTSEMKKYDPLFKKPSFVPSREHQAYLSDSSAARQEKRKRDDIEKSQKSIYTVDDDNDDEIGSQSGMSTASEPTAAIDIPGTKKKRRGWPLGKPRKPPN